MKKTMVALFAVGLLVVFIPAFGQKENPFIGTWERVSATRDGKIVAPPEGAPAGVKLCTFYKICTADGHFMQLRICDGRPVLNKSPETKEEFLSQDWGLVASYGTYSVSGDKITYKTIKTYSNRNEGTEAVWTARFDGTD
jgi:hypothetical protein